MSIMNYNDVDTKNELKMEKRAKDQVEHESSTTPHSISSIKPKDQMVDEVIVDIKAMLLDTEKPPLLSGSCCIYRVPQVSRELNTEAYTPKLISIGPFHYGNRRLQNMERYKQIFFKEFIEEAEKSLDTLVSFVKSSEPKVRACYSENINLSKKELVKMILMDASFIIKLFQNCHEGDFSAYDSILSKPWLMDILVVDLVLLENQLPLFILEELFDWIFPPHSRGDIPSFLELTFEFFNCYNKQNLDINPNFSTKHFADLVRTFHLQKQKPQRKWFEEGESHALLYSANELHEAGVKFKKNSSKCLLDLKFSRGVLEIPQIILEERTQTLLLNMIALEQCHYPLESYIADYALLLDCLINTSKDVDVLVQQQIICNYLADSNDVAKLFNNLDENFSHCNFNSDYRDICKKLNAFHKDPWNNMKATLRRDYCKTPWQIVASIAGIVLLILTLVQTICSIIQVV